MRFQGPSCSGAMHTAVACDPEEPQPRSVHAYDAVWPKDGLDLGQGQNEGEEDDVMTEEEERAAMLGARQHRRSSVAKMVLLCSLSEENSDENKASPPPSPSPCPRGQGQGLLLQPPAAEKPAPSQMFFVGDEDAVVLNRASGKKARADAQTGGLSSSKQQTVEQPANATPTVTLTRSSSVEDTLPSDIVVSPPQTESRTQKSLRKTRSVSVFPTQTLEQMIGQLCAERYTQGKLTSSQAPVCTSRTENQPSAAGTGSEEARVCLLLILHRHPQKGLLHQSDGDGQM
jgi:hypothetical protein